MGHVRLGNLPRTRKWQQVIALLESGADNAEIAQATLVASQRGLEDAANDTALLHSFWLLTQLPLCAREPDYGDALARLGLDVADEPSLMELVGGFSDAVDDHVYRKGHRTDLGEMAQMGAAETLTAVLGDRTTSLFGECRDSDAGQMMQPVGSLDNPLPHSAWLLPRLAAVIEELEYIRS